MKRAAAFGLFNICVRMESEWFFSLSDNISAYRYLREFKKVVYGSTDE